MPEFSLWRGDFNQNIPMWEEPHNHHLFTSSMLREADLLIVIVAEHEMVIILPEGIPTLNSMAMKTWMWPDNVFSSSSLEDKVIYCPTDPRLRGPGPDHVLNLTLLKLPISNTVCQYKFDSNSIQNKSPVLQVLSCSVSYAVIREHKLFT